MGDVAAGTGLVADQQVEDMVAVPDQLCADADFLLTVKGESMINAGILPGDFVVVRKQDDARNGEIVVALVGDEDATVKRFFRESGRVRLQPENDEMEPMYPEQVRILGTVQGGAATGYERALTVGRGVRPNPGRGDPGRVVTRATARPLGDLPGVRRHDAPAGRSTGGRPGRELAGLWRVRQLARGRPSRLGPAAPGRLTGAARAAMPATMRR